MAQRLERAERELQARIERAQRARKHTDQWDWDGVRRGGDSGVVLPPSSALRYGLYGLPSALREATAAGWNKVHIRVAARQPKPRHYAKPTTTPPRAALTSGSDDSDGGGGGGGGARISVLRSPSHNFFTLAGKHKVHGYVHAHEHARGDGDDDDGVFITSVNDNTTANHNGDDDDDDNGMSGGEGIAGRHSGMASAPLTTAVHVEQEVIPTCVWSHVTRVPAAVFSEHVLNGVFNVLPAMRGVEVYLHHPAAERVYADAYYWCMWSFFVNTNNNDDDDDDDDDDDNDGAVDEKSRRLVARMASNYVLLFLSVPAVHKDVFFSNYYDVLAQQVYYSICATYPESRDKLLSVNFRRQLLEQCAQWTLGYLPSDMGRRLSAWRVTRADTTRVKNAKKAPVRHSLEYMLLQQQQQQLQQLMQAATGAPHTSRQDSISLRAPPSPSPTAMVVIVSNDNESSPPAVAAVSDALTTTGATTAVVSDTPETYIVRANRVFHHSEFMRRFIDQHDINATSSHRVSVALSRSVVATDDDHYEPSDTPMVDTRTLNALTALKQRSDVDRARTDALRSEYRSKRRVMRESASSKQAVADAQRQLSAARRKAMRNASQVATSVMTEMKKRGLTRATGGPRARSLNGGDDELEQLLQDYDMSAQLMQAM